MRYVLAAIALAALYFACRTPDQAGSKLRDDDVPAANRAANPAPAVHGSGVNAALISFIVD